MSIILHCEDCKKKIIAPDNAGGKWGRCPYCQHKCYIPLPPSDDDEELKLTPIDENEETQYKQMIRETYKVTEKLLHEIDGPEENKKRIDDKTLNGRIVKYLQQMAAGQFDEAQSTADKIVIHSNQAKELLAGMLSAQEPIKGLENVPKRVLAGFIKNMITRIG